MMKYILIPRRRVSILLREWRRPKKYIQNEARHKTCVRNCMPCIFKMLTLIYDLKIKYQLDDMCIWLNVFVRKDASLKLPSFYIYRCTQKDFWNTLQANVSFAQREVMGSYSVCDSAAFSIVTHKSNHHFHCKICRKIKFLRCADGNLNALIIDQNCFYLMHTSFKH